MRLALIAFLLAAIVTIAIHAFSPKRREKMITTFRRNKWIAAEHCLLFVFGYAVPIYLLLYVDSCSQWTAFE
jgi:ABC-type antimicrobial peptide transport system permease subunit